LNLPYNPNEGVCHVMDSVSTSLWPEQEVKCAMLEFRNDLITDSIYRENMVNIITPVIRDFNKE
jgi:predicted N-formylglutamate amidohydrolase